MTGMNNEELCSRRVVVLKRGHPCGNLWKRGLCDNLFCPEPGPDLIGKVFSNLVRPHEIRVDFGRDSRILINNSCMELYLQDFCAVVISNRTQNTGFNGLPFHEYRHSLTSALEG